MKCIHCGCETNIGMSHDRDERCIKTLMDERKELLMKIDEEETEKGNWEEEISLDEVRKQFSGAFEMHPVLARICNELSELQKALFAAQKGTSLAIVDKRNLEISDTMREIEMLLAVMKRRIKIVIGRDLGVPK